MVKLKIADYITLSRYLLTLIFIFLILKRSNIAVIIFIIALITDFFDGYIARKRKETTAFGTVLDPIADRFLILSGVLALIFIYDLSILWAILIMLRDIIHLILLIFSLFDKNKEKYVTHTIMISKITTVTQALAIISMLILGGALNKITLSFIIIATIMNIATIISYSHKIIKKI
ncbi:CDP-alcohol phosphatidyltransferase family protein [Candidatus Woesearchaeota archaeon]|nr:CDP-alcohol phosphatidyltransferase family protein [Candidatus Woesearchaeota archaeon]